MYVLACLFLISAREQIHCSELCSIRVRGGNGGCAAHAQLRSGKPGQLSTAACQLTALPCVRRLYLRPHKGFCCSWISLLSNTSFTSEIEVWQTLPKSSDFRGSMPRVRTPLWPSLLPVFETAFVCSPPPPRCSWAPLAVAPPPSLGRSRLRSISSISTGRGSIMSAIRSHLLLSWLQVGSHQSPFEITALQLSHK